jgi:hypothetical protein
MGIVTLGYYYSYSSFCVCVCVSFFWFDPRDSSSVSKRWQTWEAIGSNRFWPKRSQEKTIWFPSCLHGCIASFQLCCDSYHLLGRSSCLTLHIWSLVYNDWRHCECLPSLPNFHCCAKVSRENAAADIRKNTETTWGNLDTVSSSSRQHRKSAARLDYIGYLQKVK